MDINIFSPQAHTETCTNELNLPEDVSKADAEKLRSHILSRSIPDTDTRKPLSQKLSELKSKPLSEESAEGEVLIPNLTHEDPSELVLELVEESDHEVSNEIAEEMKNCEPSVGNTCECFKNEISEI